MEHGLTCERCKARAYCGRRRSLTPVECDYCDQPICTSCGVKVAPTVTELYFFCDADCVKAWHDGYHEEQAESCDQCGKELCAHCSPFDEGYWGEGWVFCSEECHDAREVRDAIRG